NRSPPERSQSGARAGGRRRLRSTRPESPCAEYADRPSKVLPMRWALLVLVLAVCATAGAAATRGAASAPTLGQLVGQRLVVGMRGTAPSAFLLDRIRTGEVGGVILFGRNVRNRLQARALTAALRAAAQTA